MDECVEGLHDCDDNSYCSNAVGSYTCKSHRKSQLAFLFLISKRIIPVIRSLKLHTFFE